LNRKKIKTIRWRRGGKLRNAKRPKKKVARNGWSNQGKIINVERARKRYSESQANIRRQPKRERTRKESPKVDKK
jgi:hypothetical protein